MKPWQVRLPLSADEMIFTSVALDPLEGGVWWEGEDFHLSWQKPSYENESATK
jgi:GTP-dependent phosphoenolpyruvate carboxykinase